MILNKYSTFVFVVCAFFFCFICLFYGKCLCQVSTNLINLNELGIEYIDGAADILQEGRLASECHQHF